MLAERSSWLAVAIAVAVALGSGIAIERVRDVPDRDREEAAHERELMERLERVRSLHGERRTCVCIPRRCIDNPLAAGCM
jgi:hypothetical protein